MDPDQDHIDGVADIDTEAGGIWMMLVVRKETAALLLLEALAAGDRTADAMMCTRRKPCRATAS